MSVTPSSPPLRILVVEDESIIAMMIEDMLLDLGYEVIGPAADLAQGHELLAEHGCDAALLDVNLSGTPSFPLAETLYDQGIPFAFSSGYGNEGLPPHFQHIPTLSKPYLPDDVQRVLTMLTLPQVS